MLSTGMKALTTLFSFVRFEHTLFSLPLLLAGAILGARGLPAARTLALILVAGIGARTAALALNRILDREIDAHNPRTASRELPAGRLSLTSAWGVAATGSAVYVCAAALLPPLCLKLSPLPLAVFVGYPYLKRFTILAHLGVGLGLALGTLGAWIAVTGTFGPLGPAHLLALFTFLWVSGFDVIYATLDEQFDRETGLHSLPARLGRKPALAVAAALHALGFGVLAFATSRYLATPAAWTLLALVGLLFLLEHRLAHRVDLVFFRINAALGFVVLALVWTGLPALP